MKMLTEERFAVIRSLLADDSVVKIQAIVEATQASESTVRRDLSQLENLGELVRVHGGAKRVFSVDLEPSVSEKRLQFQSEKLAIGRYAASLIKDGEFVFIDAGTTTLAMVPFIQAENVTIVTNGLELAAQLADSKFTVILLGGLIKPNTRAMIGSDTQKQLRQYRFSRAFMGTNGINARFGFTTPDTQEAHVKESAIGQASRVYVLADNSKFDKVSFCQFADFDKVMVVTNQLSKSLHEKFAPLLDLEEV